MIGFWSHIIKSESPVAKYTLKLVNKIYNEGNNSWFTRIAKTAGIVGINQNSFGES